MRVFGLKSCDTTRAALAALRAAGHAPAFVDLREDGLDPADLDAILAAFGDRAVNRASTTWRGLAEAERAAAPADLIRAHPALLKRPVIAADGRWYQGWTPAVQAALIETG